MCFPSVKFLRVLLKYPENHLTKKFFSSCPLLEDLWINVYFKYHGPTKKFIISLSTLKRFSLAVLVEDFYNYINPCDHKCVITAPVLELLHFVDDMLALYVLYDLHFLQTVKLDMFYPDWSGVNPNRAL